jgi:3-deoxy-D-manno-octulosonic-acid transferase
MENFHAIVAEMAARGAAHEVADAEELVKALERLLTDAELRREVANTAQAIATAKDGILDAVLGQLEPALAGIAARGRGGRRTAHSTHGSGHEDA